MLLFTTNMENKLQTNSSARLFKQQQQQRREQSNNSTVAAAAARNSFRVLIVKNFMRFSMWKLCKIKTP